MAPVTSTRPTEAPEVLLDVGEAAARQIEGGGGARGLGGEDLERWLGFG
jgi:hypothetical protein